MRASYSERVSSRQRVAGYRGPAGPGQEMYKGSNMDIDGKVSVNTGLSKARPRCSYFSIVFLSIDVDV